MKTYSQKANLDTENVKSTKLPKKNLLKVQKLLCSNSQKSCRNVLIKVFFCSKVPSGQLKCSFENPAVTFSPGVSKNLPKSGKENVRKKFFSKNYSSERCSGLVDGSFDVPAEKKAENPISVRTDSGKKVKKIFLKENLISYGKFVWT